MKSCVLLLLSIHIDDLLIRLGYIDKRIDEFVKRERAKNKKIEKELIEEASK